MALPEIEQLERLFPGLRGQPFVRTSPATPRYNCTAWANGSAERWWDPSKGYFWSKGIPRDGTIESYVKLFELCGFVSCGSDSLEVGIEKIAIYGHGFAFKHVARQLDNGSWTSKLGKLADIEHRELQWLVGKAYGVVVLYMSRTRPHPLSGKLPPMP
jgi:hypothetical protein